MCLNPTYYLLGVAASVGTRRTYLGPHVAATPEMRAYWRALPP